MMVKGDQEDSRPVVLSLGIRQALAHTSATAFPLAALVDVSRQTATRAENAAWSTLVARTGSLHALMCQKMRSLANVFVDLCKAWKYHACRP